MRDERAGVDTIGIENKEKASRGVPTATWEISGDPIRERVSVPRPMLSCSVRVACLPVSVPRAPVYGFIYNEVAVLTQNTADVEITHGAGQRVGYTKIGPRASPNRITQNHSDQCVRAPLSCLFLQGWFCLRGPDTQGDRNLSLLTS